MLDFRAETFLAVLQIYEFHTRGRCAEPYPAGGFPTYQIFGKPFIMHLYF